MIASLPMYDRPETRGATDRFWHLIRDGLRARRIAAPDELTRSGDPMADWRAPDLVFSQCCGLPYRAQLSDILLPFAVADYGLGLPDGRYTSVIVSHTAGPLQTPRLAVNDPLSQSGWAALVTWLRFHRMTPGSVTFTGSHAASARLVLARKADIAAIDAHTWQLMQTYDGWSHDLCDITIPDGCAAARLASPGLPFVTRRGNDPAVFRAALTDAAAALSEDDRHILRIERIHPVGPEAYLALSVPPPPDEIVGR